MGNEKGKDVIDRNSERIEKSRRDDIVRKENGRLPQTENSVPMPETKPPRKEK